MTDRDDAKPKWIAFPGKVPVCRDCGTDWHPVRRGECSRCGSDAGPLACGPWNCDGSGRSKQGWSANYGDQFGPCGRPCQRLLPPGTTVERDA